MRFPHRLALLKAGAYQRDESGTIVTDDAGFPVEVEQAPIFFSGWLQPSPTATRIRESASEAAVSQDESGEAFTSHMLFAPVGLPIRQGDRIRREPGDGLYYEVARDPEDAGGRGHHLEVDLVEFRYPEVADGEPSTLAPLIIEDDTGEVGAVLGGGVEVES